MDGNSHYKTDFFLKKKKIIAWKTNLNKRGTKVYVFYIFLFLQQIIN